ncbi:MAG: hypothetical protein HOQ09_06840 [Gemmatimonadaceae bacterium]|nr:hypothetical protein [Gemmatimonadaceae bacterium]
MSAPRSRIALRAALTLLGAAVVSVLVLIGATELNVAVQGDRVAPWVAFALMVLAVVAGWLTIWAARGSNPLARLAPERRTIDRAPRRVVAARVLLAFSALLELLFLMGLPLRSLRWGELVTAEIIVAQLVATLYAAITLAHRDPRGRHVAIVLGAWMVSQLLRSTFQLAAARGNPNAGAAPAMSYLLAWLCFGGAIVAALCVLSLRDDWPPRNIATDAAVVS